MKAPDLLKIELKIIETEKVRSGLIRSIKKRKVD
jgi:hypothetical protein